VRPNQIVSSVAKILDLDLNTMKKSDVEFANEYSLKIDRTTQIHGLVSWFDCFFVDEQRPRGKVTLSTSPANPVTHWK
jgi:hypothetical protein